MGQSSDINVTIALISEKRKRFGGNGKISAIESKIVSHEIYGINGAKTEVYSEVVLSGTIEAGLSYNSKMESFSISISYDNIIEIIRQYEENLRSKAALYENHVSERTLDQMNFTITLLCERISQLLKTDPRWTDVRGESVFADEPELLDVDSFSNAIGDRLKEADIESLIRYKMLRLNDVNQPSDLNISEKKIIDIFDSALQSAIVARHARSLLKELEELTDFLEVKILSN